MSGQQRNRSIGIISDRKFEWVLKAIADTGFTDSEFAAELTDRHGNPLGINQRTIKRFKNNENVEKKTFAAIARLLEADVAWLTAPDPVKRLPRAYPQNFCGKEREAMQEQLQEALRQNESAVYCLTGRSGIGKTTQVLRLAYEDAKRDNPYFSGGYCFIQVGLVSIAHELEYFFRLLSADISFFSEPLHSDIDAKRIQEWYAQIYDFDIKVLLIFDKVSSYGEIRDFLPLDTHKNIRILITSTNQNLSDRFEIIELKDFSETDAKTYLRKILAKDEAFFQRHQSALQQICRSVGYLPFALSVIGHYIKQNYGIVPGVIDDVLMEIEQDSRLANVLCELPEDSEYLLDDFPEDLRTKLQDEGLRAMLDLVWHSYSPEAVGIACALAFFAPIEIYFSLIRECFPNVDIGLFKKILSGTLVTHSLVDAREDEEGIYILHDLTRKYLRESFLNDELVGRLTVNTVNSFTTHLENEPIYGRPTPNVLRLMAHLDYFIREAQENPIIYANATEIKVKLFTYQLCYFYQSKQFTEKHRHSLEHLPRNNNEVLNQAEMQLSQVNVLFTEYCFSNDDGKFDEALKLTQDSLTLIEKEFSEYVPSKQRSRTARICSSTSPQFWTVFASVMNALMKAHCLRLRLYIEKRLVADAEQAWNEAYSAFDLFEAVSKRRKEDCLLGHEISFLKAKLSSFKGQITHLTKDSKSTKKLMNDAERTYKRIVKENEGNLPVNKLYRSRAGNSLAKLLPVMIRQGIERHDSRNKVDALLEKYEKVLKEFDLRNTLDTGNTYRYIGAHFYNCNYDINKSIDYLRKSVDTLSNAPEVPAEMLSKAQSDLNALLAQQVIIDSQYNPSL